MAYREITMIEIKEVLRRWISGIPKKRLAAQLGLDPKTVRRYVNEAENCGVRIEDGLEGLTDELVGAVVVALKQPAAHPHGDPWWACEAERSFIEGHLKDGLRLTKILRLLTRKGVEVPYSTLLRISVIVNTRVGHREHPRRAGAERRAHGARIGVGQGEAELMGGFRSGRGLLAAGWSL